jgi:hypothetical protein
VDVGTNQEADRRLIRPREGGSRWTGTWKLNTPDTCSVCGQSFASEDELRSHEARQHPEVGESEAIPAGSSAVRRDPAMGWGASREAASPEDE